MEHLNRTHRVPGEPDELINCPELSVRPACALQVVSLEVDTCNAFSNWCRNIAAIEEATRQAAGKLIGDNFTHLAVVMPDVPQCGATGLAWIGE